MAVLQQVNTEGVALAQGIGAAGTPLREDRGPAYALQRPIEHFAPSMRDGFILVPRLATHEHLEGAGDELEDDA